MSGHNPFDMDFDGDVDGIDFLGFDYLMRCILGRQQPEDDDDSAAASHPSEDEEEPLDT